MDHVATGGKALAPAMQPVKRRQLLDRQRDERAQLSGKWGLLGSHKMKSLRATGLNVSQNGRTSVKPITRGSGANADLAQSRIPWMPYHDR